MPNRATPRLKRTVDVVGSAAALIVLSPLFFAISVTLLACQGWPLLYRQERAGHSGRLFRIYKFRTMSNATGPNGQLLPDGARITRVGRWLRRTSLDELPELVNVLAGQMSLVGPRPLPAAYLPLYDDNQRRCHEVRPGLTGLAQIHGRNSLGWEERFTYDVYYVDHQSLLFDLKILLNTVPVVVRGRGLNAQDGVISEPFRGSQPLG
jgi:lipopolysaccharide/colanic/teichoic acid biosynthesis glycosyltransferase